MVIQAIGEIKSLEAERERILNGSQEKIDELENKIRELKKLKEQCKIIEFMKKRNFNKEISVYQAQQEQIFKQR